MNKLQLGCGLIRIGRPWGVNEKPVPTESEARDFLEYAFNLGIRFFDTAPSYGSSEKRLGAFLKSLTTEQRKSVTVATKFSEHWDDTKNEPYVDYDLDALKDSIDNSFSLLESIDIIQLHKATPDNVSDSNVIKAFEYASSCGVVEWGVSVSNVESGRATLNNNRFKVIQLPYNQERTELLPIIKKTVELKRNILFNRPLAMGGVVNDKAGLKLSAIKDAYKLICKTGATGYILTGTATTNHLKENYTIFKEILHE